MALTTKICNYTSIVDKSKISECGYRSLNMFFHFNMSITVLALLLPPQAISFQFPSTDPLDSVSGAPTEVNVELNSRIGIGKSSVFLHLSKLSRLRTMRSL